MDLNLLEATIIGLLALIIVLLVLTTYWVRKGARPMPNGELAEVKKLIENLESRLQTMSANNNVSSEVKTMCQDLQSKLEKWEESHTLPKVSQPSLHDFDERFGRIMSGIGFIVNHFKIAEDITKYGSLIGDAYDNFIDGVNDEFDVLEQRRVTGSEHVFRSNMLLFSLIMARVYMGLYAPSDSLRRLEDYIEKAKRLA